MFSAKRFNLFQQFTRGFTKLLDPADLPIRQSSSPFGYRPVRLKMALKVELYHGLSCIVSVVIPENKSDPHARVIYAILQYFKTAIEQGG
jgi:hypothetical protein